MNNAAKLFSILFISAAVLITGCTKKPSRPTPDLTAFGQGGAGPAGSSLTPIPVDMAADSADLTQRDPNSNIREDEFTIRGMLKDVYFDYDRSAIKPSERVKLDEAIKYLAEHPEHRILLEGHCDWRGTAEYNLGLGDRRASAARQYLLSKQVDPKKIEVLSKGSLEAIKGGTDEQMGKDRRAEIVILKK